MQPGKHCCSKNVLFQNETCTLGIFFPTDPRGICTDQLFAIPNLMHEDRGDWNHVKKFLSIGYRLSGSPGTRVLVQHIVIGEGFSLWLFTPVQ